MKPTGCMLIAGGIACFILVATGDYRWIALIPGVVCLLVGFSFVAGGK